MAIIQSIEKELTPFSEMEHEMQKIVGQYVTITCDMWGSRTFCVHSNKPFLGMVNNADICNFIQRWWSKGFEVKLFNQGKRSEFHSIRSSASFTLEFDTFPKELYPVAEHINFFKRIDDKNTQQFRHVYIDNILDKAAIEDICPYTAEIAVGKNSILRDVTEINWDRLLTTTFYFEDHVIANILRDKKNIQDRNKFIDQLIEAGYEEWI